MDSNVKYVYSSLFNHLDDHTFTGKCSLLDILNNTGTSSLNDCKMTLYRFYQQYYNKMEDITFCLNVYVHDKNNKTTYIKDLKIKGEIKDECILKLCKENETLVDTFISSVERSNNTTLFQKYDKVFDPHGLDRDVTTALSNKRPSTEPLKSVKTEVIDEIPINVPKRSETEVKKEWSAPKAKQRGIDSMFKKRSNNSSAISKPIEVKKEDKSPMNMDKKLEDRFQFTSKTLINKRREDESKKEEERMKIIKERLNNMSKPSTVKRERTEELEPENVKKAKPMEDIFNSDSDYVDDDIEPLNINKDNEQITTVETSEPKDNNMSMASDSTGFIELVLNNEKKNKVKPKMVLESDSQDSSSDE
ncbi:uncharacterized protein HGUI_01648 [Hanseniaspora guilliermondii]|uniref:Uncharacterized protein n=1 Tax=Hanseniaspora guilliermondii TaxID=56406 RepID=A0A1L0AZA9_9ASCO|nr:uncharacterized protein HGUI_01648 [Hanseniaspora guilliermondii]